MTGVRLVSGAGHEPGEDRQRMRQRQGGANGAGDGVDQNPVEYAVAHGSSAFLPADGGNGRDDQGGNGPAQPLADRQRRRHGFEGIQIDR